MYQGCDTQQRHMNCTQLRKDHVSRPVCLILSRAFLVHESKFHTLFILWDQTFDSSSIKGLQSMLSPFRKDKGKGVGVGQYSVWALETYNGYYVIKSDRPWRSRRREGHLVDKILWCLHMGNSPQKPGSLGGEAMHRPVAGILPYILCSCPYHPRNNPANAAHSEASVCPYILHTLSRVTPQIQTPVTSRTPFGLLFISVICCAKKLHFSASDTINAYAKTRIEEIASILVLYWHFQQ